MSFRNWAVAGLAVAGLVFGGAGKADASVRSRLHHQWQRIKQGRRDGEISDSEFHRLRRQERHIRRSYYSDGYVSPREHASLEHRLNRESRRIHHDRHN